MPNLIVSTNNLTLTDDARKVNLSISLDNVSKLYSVTKVLSNSTLYIDFGMRDDIVFFAGFDAISMLIAHLNYHSDCIYRL